MPGVLLAPEGWLSPSVFPDNSEILWIPSEERMGPMFFNLMEM